MHRTFDYVVTRYGENPTLNDLHNNNKIALYISQTQRVLLSQ